MTIFCVMVNAAKNSADDSAIMALYKLNNIKVNDDEAMIFKRKVVAGDIKDKGWCGCRCAICTSTRYAPPSRLIWIFDH